MKQEDLQALNYDDLQMVWHHELRCLDTAITAERTARHEKLFYRERVRKIEAEMARRKQNEEEEGERG